MISYFWCVQFCLFVLMRIRLSIIVNWLTDNKIRLWIEYTFSATEWGVRLRREAYPSSDGNRPRLVRPPVDCPCPHQTLCTAAWSIRTQKCLTLFPFCKHSFDCTCICSLFECLIDLSMMEVGVRVNAGSLTLRSDKIEKRGLLWTKLFISY